MVKGISDKGIILRRGGFGETDSIMTIFSQNHGKLRVLAKGARKTTSKFMGHLEPLSLVKFSAVYGKSFLILTFCEVEKSFRELKKDTKNINLALYMSEVVDLLNPEDEPNKETYKLLVDTFSNVKQDEDLQLAIFLYYALALAGFSPNVESCIKCGKESKEDPCFSFYWGGLVCKKCSASDEPKRIDAKVIDSLAKISRMDINDTDEEDYSSAKILLMDFVEYINDKKVKSSKYV